MSDCRAIEEEKENFEKLSAIPVEDLKELFANLTPEEEKIMRLRFGMEDSYSRTLEELCEEFNLSYASIPKIEAKALRKYRRLSIKKRLKDQ